MKKSTRKAPVKILEWKNTVCEINILLDVLGNFPDSHNYELP